MPHLAESHDRRRHTLHSAPADALWATIPQPAGAVVHMLWAMEAHPASQRNERIAGSAPPWAGGVVVAATAIVIFPITVTASWTWHLIAAVLLTALTVAAIMVSGPAPLRTMIYLDVAFLLFALASHGRWPPAVTAVLVCLVPLLPCWPPTEQADYAHPHRGYESASAPTAQC